MKFVQSIIQHLFSSLLTIALFLSQCSHPSQNNSNSTNTNTILTPTEGEYNLEGEGANEEEIIIPWEVETPFLLTYKIIATYPHDKEAFTQGLYYQNGLIYESTGLWEKSSVRIVDLYTGTIILKRELPSNYNGITFSNLFGEGLALIDSELYQLTWQNNVCFVYDSTDLSLKRIHRYDGEGWGLTYDGIFLIRSDGTNTLYFHYPENFESSHSINVFENSSPIKKLNELEYIEGYICANVWQTNYIVVIDPQTGNVVGKILMDGLITQQNNPQADVLNGIAYIPERKTLLVTGKLWDTIFEIALVRTKRNQ